MDKLRKLFGDRLRTLRKARGLSQEALAEKADTHFTYIGVIERGEQSPTLDTVEKIAKALDMETKELFLFPSGEQAESESLKIQVEELLKAKDTKTIRQILRILKQVLRLSKEKT